MDINIYRECRKKVPLIHRLDFNNGENLDVSDITMHLSYGLYKRVYGKEKADSKFGVGKDRKALVQMVYKNSSANLPKEFGEIIDGSKEGDDPVKLFMIFFQSSVQIFLSGTGEIFVR